MATNHAVAQEQVYNKAKFKMNDRQRLRVVSNSYDAATDGTIDAGAGDTVEILTIPANCIILGASLVVTTAETANGSCNFGIKGGDVDCFLDGGVLSALGTVDEFGAFVPGYHTGSGATLLITATTDGADVDLDGVAFTAYCTYMELDAQVSKN